MAKQSDSDETSAPPSSSSWLAYLVVGIVLVVLLMIVMPLFRKSPILELLRDMEYARGLIAFLISIGTIAVALILVVSGLFLQVDDE